jgi:hypothetical protein
MARTLWAAADPSPEGLTLELLQGGEGLVAEHPVRRAAGPVRKRFGQREPKGDEAVLNAADRVGVVIGRPTFDGGPAAGGRIEAGVAG